MNAAYAMVKLDFRMIKPYFKTLFLFGMVLGPLLGVAMIDLMFVDIYMAISVVLMVGYPFAIGEKNNMDVLIASLPILRKEVIIGRYLTLMATLTASAVLILVEKFVLSQIIGAPFDFRMVLNVEIIVMSAIAMVASYQFPMFLILGYQKARIWVFLPFALLALVTGMLPSISTEVKGGIEEFFLSLNLHTMASAMGLLALSLLAISFCISSAYYTRIKKA